MDLQERIRLILEYIEVDDDFADTFRAVAGSDLERCVDVDGFLKGQGISVSGNDIQVTWVCFMDTVALLYGNDEVEVSSKRGNLVAKSLGKRVVGSDAGQYVSKTLGVDELEEYEGGKYSEDEEELEGIEEELEEDDVSSKEDLNKKELYEKIKSYYFQYYKGVVNELMKRYTSLFESGYEVVRPAGILCGDGIVGLSGSSVSVYNKSIAVDDVYDIFATRLGFTVINDRSNIKIADTIYENYRRGGKLLYFPYKLLEYAYGRKAPSGDNQNSLNTYEKHSSASNWSAYRDREVKKSLMAVIGGSVVKYVIEGVGGNGDYFTKSMASSLREYLKYLQNCLSLCILVPEYKFKKSGFEEDVYAFKFRVCDPENSLGVDDLTPDIINKAFMGSTGDVPFSYKPRIESGVFVKEYSHEFNHDSSQAMPLFAYKAYLALRDQEVEPTWNNMILGMFEDGSILKNGKHGVSLERRLTHQIGAGSRAGKGVMTLNILVSGIYSGKYEFYLDRKPDMASLMKKLSPNMFVMNGGGYSERYDFYREFTSVDSSINWNNVPNYVTNMLGVSKNYNELGDLFYMRALKLVMGIIIARGDGSLLDKAPNGILFVVDEFKNFQESYSVLIEKFISNVPPCNYDTILEKFNSGKVTQAEFDKSFNDGSFYAISYLNSLISDMEFLSSKRDAGFDPKEIEMSDIFVIGQSFSYGSLDYRPLKTAISDSTNSERYRNVGSTGLKSQVLKSGDSIPYTMLDFKTSDAFFGRNMEDGRDVYLAQRNSDSKAYGRLDDKASNFAYLDTFSDDVRRKIVGGNVQDNIRIANSCTYFKPFLVLNTSGRGDDCVEAMFDRCAGAGNEPGKEWVSREEIIRENPNSTGDFINEAVGFEGYLNLMGVRDYSERLSKSGDLANYVVQECLHYPGTWFEFITDLRPEWCFTIKDIFNGAKGIVPDLNKIESNPVISEFVKFNPQLFKIGGVGLDNEDSSVSNFIDGDEEIDLFSDIEDSIFKETGDLLNHEGDYDDGNFEEVTFSADDFHTEIKDSGIPESNFKGNSKSEEIEALLNRLEELGVRIPKAEQDYVNSGKDDEDYRRTDSAEYNDRIDFDGSIDSYTDLIKYISMDVVNKFGGLEEIVSLRVVGGSLVVNEYYYRCNASDLFTRGMPYDIKREIKSGNIARLFDYGLLPHMPRLRELEVDSPSFVYDYVAYGLGHGSRVSVDLFFRDLRSLQTLCIGRKLYTRRDYREKMKQDDPFYNPRFATKIADYSESAFGSLGNSAWRFTKSSFSSKQYGAVMKTIRVAGGLTGTVAGAAGKATVKGARTVSGVIGRSFKRFIDDIKNY